MTYVIKKRSNGSYMLFKENNKGSSRYIADASSLKLAKAYIKYHPIKKRVVRRPVQRGLFSGGFRI